MVKIKAFCCILLASLFVGSFTAWYFTAHQEGYRGTLNLPNQKLVIFDFDGTLCNSLQDAIEAFNSVAYFWGLKPIEDLNEVRTLSLQQIFKTHGATNWKLPIIKYQLMKRLTPHIPKMEPSCEIREILLTLKKQGYRIGMLTSNSNENTDQFLKNHHLNEFDFVYYGGGFFGKARLLEKIKSKTRASVVYYVGDETRDIDAARASNVTSIAVTWGYQSKELLAKHFPSFMIDNPQELMEILK